jgi:hypothetical protein
VWITPHFIFIRAKQGMSAASLRLGLQGSFSEGMPANRAAGVAVAMEHCNDLRQIEIAL